MVIVSFSYRRQGDDSTLTPSGLTNKEGSALDASWRSTAQSDVKRETGSFISMNASRGASFVKVCSLNLAPVTVVLIIIHQKVRPMMTGTGLHGANITLLVYSTITQPAKATYFQRLFPASTAKEESRNGLL